MKLNKISDFSEAKTRRQKVEDREQSILSVARDMFNDKGYDKTTIAEIAKKSGVADGTVYLYFKNKEALARGVLSQFYHDLTEAAQRGVDKRNNPRSRLRFLAKHHLNAVIDNRRLLEALPRNDMAIDNYEGSELHKMNRAYVAIFDRVVKDGALQGIIRPELVPWVLRDMFFGSMDYAARTIILKGKSADTQTFIEGLMTLMTSPVTGSNSLESIDALTRLEAIVNRLDHATQKIETRP